MVENYNPEIKPTEPVEPWPVHGGCSAKVKTEVLTDIQGKLSGLDKTRASTGDIVEALQTIKPLVVGVLMFLSMGVGAAVTPMYVPHYKVGGQVMVMTNIQEWAESSGSSSGDEPEFIAWRDINDSLRAGPHSMVGPRRNVAIGVSALAFGDEDPTGGNGGATAIGENAIATNIAATAVGTVSAATGPMSSAYGGNAHAEAEQALAVGWGSLAEAINSSAIGNGTRTHHGALGSTAIGSGAVVGANATNAVQIGFGTNDDPETLQFMDRKVLLDDLDYARYEVVTNDYGEEWVYFCGLPGWTVTLPTWNSSESRWQSYFTDPIEGSPWLIDWSDPEAKGYDATLLTIDGYKSVAYRGIHMVTNLVHSRISTTNDLSHANPVFSNEVLAVSLELFDTNTVAVLNDLAGTVDGIPLEGGAASIGTILLALLAAVAWLKKNKIGADDVKRVYNVNGTQYIDGDGGVYTAQFEKGGHWTMERGSQNARFEYTGFDISFNCYRWRDTSNVKSTCLYSPSTGKFSAFGASIETGKKGLNPENGDDIGGPYTVVGATFTFFKQDSVFPSEPQDKIAKKSELDGKANSSDIPSLSGQTFDMSVDAQFKDMCIAMARELGAVVTHTTDDTSTGSQVAQAYGITPTDATTFGELQTKAGLNDNDTLGDL